ncbi:MAG: twin-arginine translocase TatA/TatE family subunit [Rickettsiales bacterium]|jgi:Sec-independent protein translocase protein TatA|nr:twin-arginine translocase TatA/TatE family subunit [Rickettsiales bacterium]
MLGISGLEFLVILIIAVAVVPANRWPEVARWLGKIVRHIRNIIGRIQDGIDDLENEIAKEVPIDKLSQRTMDDMIETFSTRIKPRTGRKCKK